MSNVIEEYEKEFVKNIIKYENGEMTEGEEIEFFQELVISGKLYSLQGHYRRHAVHLLAEGKIKRAQMFCEVVRNNLTIDKK